MNLSVHPDEYVVVVNEGSEAALMAVTYPSNEWLESQGDMAAALLSNYINAFNCITRELDSISIQSALEKWPDLDRQGVVLANAKESCEGANRLLAAAEVG